MKSNNKITASIILAVLLALACAGAPQAAVIFSDTFEAGLGLWVATAQSGCIAGATDTVVNNGAGSFASVDNSTSATTAYLTKTLTASGTTYIRFYTYLDTGFLTPMPSVNDQRTIFQVKTSSNVGLYFQVYRRSAGINFTFKDSVTNAEASYTGTFAENTWVCHEMKISACGPHTTFEWWVNGSKTGVGQLLERDWSAATGITSIILGLGWCNSGTWLQKMYFDDVIVSDSYIGQASGVDAKPTVSITYPASGGQLSGVVGVTATAADDNAVNRVVFYVDGVAKSTDTTSPYGFAWDTALNTNAPHSVRAEAFDTIGQSASSQVNVTVDNLGLAPVSDSHVWLHVDGKYVKTSPDANPPEQIWRGCGPAWAAGVWVWSSCINPTTKKPSYDLLSAIPLIRDLHANLIRYCFSALPFPQAFGVGLGGRWGLTYQETVDNWIKPVVDAAKAQHIYVSLNEHCHQPCGHTDMTNTAADKITCSSYTWTDPDYQRWEDLWMVIASNFIDEPWIESYEIANEILPLSKCPGWTYAEWRLRCQSAVAAVRQIDSRHIIKVSGVNWDHLESMNDNWKDWNYQILDTKNKAYPNIAFVFHDYMYTWYTSGNGKKVSIVPGSPVSLP